MTNKPRRPYEKLLSTLAILSVLPSPGWARQGIYKEFLSGSEIVTVSGEQIDEHRARIDAVQIAHDQYHELRILNPNTGATEILEFSDPKLQMTYTLPFHGKFLKLQIKRREKDGLRTADFALASDESHYIPLRQNFRKYRAFRQDIDLGGIAVCKMPQQSLVNKAGIDPVIDALLDTPQNIATRCLDTSCQKEPFLSEYRFILGGISQVIASRDSKSSNSQKFLACLKDNQLGYFAEKLKTYFSDALKPSSKPTVVCSNTNNGTRGEFFENENPDAATINLNRPWAYSSSTEPESDAQSFYADTFFHESLHRAGLEDEDLTADAVSCCGMESLDGKPEVCAKVKDSVAQINARNARLKASLSVLDGFKDFWLTIQKTNDEEQANALYDDFFELFGSRVETNRKSMEACLSASADGSEGCIQTFAQSTNQTIDDYFVKTCPAHVTAKKRDERAALCKQLDAGAKAIFETNLNKVCDPSKSNAFARSCLAAVGEKTKDILAEANDQGNLIDDPDGKSTSAQSEEEKKVRDAVLTALRNQIPGVEAAFNSFKDEVNDAVHPRRAQNIFSDLLDFMAGKTKNLRADYDTCIEKGGDKASCAEKTKHSFFNGKKGLNHFFKSICPKSFTRSENSEKPCKEMKQQISQAFNDSFSGGCKTTDTSKQIGVPGDDLTCFFNVLAEAKYNIANYAELQKANKIVNSNAKALSVTPDKEAKDVAGNVSNSDGKKPQSISIGDQTSKPSRKSTPSYADNSASRGDHRYQRSPASSEGHVYANDIFDEKSLKEELARQPAPTRKVLQSAGNVLSDLADLAVPRAEAKTRREVDTSALAVPTPPPLAYQAAPGFAAQASIAGDVEAATKAIRTGTMGSAFPSAARRAVIAKSGAPEAKEKTQSTTAKSEADTRSGASGDKQTGRSPASTSVASKSAAKASAAKHGQTASASTTSGQNTDRGSKASEATDNLHHIQNSFLKHFKDDPKGALARLKSGALSNELKSYFIEAKDDEGHSYGSNSPKIKIWYDQSTGVFKGLPDL